MDINNEKQNISTPPKKRKNKEMWYPCTFLLVVNLQFLMTSDLLSYQVILVQEQRTSLSWRNVPKQLIRWLSGGLLFFAPTALLV